MATGLGIRACQVGHRVAFATAAQWVARLAEAHQAGRLSDELTRLGRIPLIVVDEVSYIPFEPEAANLGTAAADVLPVIVAFAQDCLDAMPANLTDAREPSLRVDAASAA
ncbi:ATP-binding protein [Streptomyces monashensis]|uniref:ATP-binding protein n=1 Tax=Streptomyces monashensis TaxID=1678012 RepID=UPI0033C7D620